MIDRPDIAESVVSRVHVKPIYPHQTTEMSAAGSQKGGVKYYNSNYSVYQPSQRSKQSKYSRKNSNDN